MPRCGAPRVGGRSLKFGISIKPALNKIDNMKRYGSLDGIRGVLALLVAIGHGYYWNGVTHLIPISFTLSVDFFFCLSGFVLASTMYKDDQTTRRWFSSFLLRRFLRLFPVYLIALILTCFSFVYLREGFPETSWKMWAVLLTLTSHIGLITTHPFFTDTVPSIAWSASVEFWIGLPTFFIAYALRHQKKLTLLLFTLAWMSAISYLAVCSPNYMDVTWQLAFKALPMASLRALIGFSLGISCYALRERLPLLSGSLIELLMVGLILILYGHHGYDRRLDYLFPVLSCFIILVFHREAGAISRLLNHPSLQFLGHISYPVYLLHPIALDISKKYIIGVLHAPAIYYCLITLILATISHYLVELPWIRLSRHLSAKLDTFWVEKIRKGAEEGPRPTT